MPASSTHLLHFFKQAPFHCHTSCPSLLGENIYRDTSLYVFKSFLKFFFPFLRAVKALRTILAAARIRPVPNMLTGIKLFILNPFCVQVSPPLQHVSCKLFGVWIVFLICVCTVCSTTEPWPLPDSMEGEKKVANGMLEKGLISLHQLVGNQIPFWDKLRAN